MELISGHALNQNGIEATRRRTGKTHQIVPRSQNDPPSLGGAYARRRPPEIATTALANLDKNQGSVGFAHDQVDLPTSATWGPEVGLYPPQPPALQVFPSQQFGQVSPALGGNLLLMQQVTGPIGCFGTLGGLSH